MQENFLMDFYTEIAHEDTMSVIRRHKEGPDWSLFQFAFICLSFGGTFAVSFCPILATLYFSGSFHVYYAGTLVFLCGPVIYLQLRLGSEMEGGVVCIMAKSVPWLKGIGMAALMMQFLDVVASSVDMALAIQYAFLSLSSPFGWLYSSRPVNVTSQNQFMNEYNYLKYDVLEVSSGINEVGGISPHMGYTLTAAWVIVLLLIGRGMRYVGYTLAVLGVATVTVALSLMAYGRKVFAMDGVEPARDFYITIWEYQDVGTLDAIFPQVSLCLKCLHVWTSVLPTMGKCCGKTRCISFGATVVLIVVVCALPHLVIHTLAPFTHALISKLSIVFQEMINDNGFADTFMNNIFVLLPRVFEELHMAKGLAFLWFFMVFLFYTMYQALFTAIIVDNVIENLHPITRKYIPGKTTLCMVVSAIFCALGLFMSLPMVTKGGFYLLVLVKTEVLKFFGIVVIISMVAYLAAFVKRDTDIYQKIGVLAPFIFSSLPAAGLLLYDMEWAENGTFQVWLEDGTVYSYPAWTTALDWLITLAPLVLGLVGGVIHTAMQRYARNVDPVGASVQDDEERREPVSTKPPAGICMTEC